VEEVNYFVNFANETISDIETFKQEWCKVKSLPKASWIGENKMAFVRLSSFLYGMFFLNETIKAELSIHVSNKRYGQCLSCFVIFVDVKEIKL
jgi:hypothetical protein